MHITNLEEEKKSGVGRAKARGEKLTNFLSYLVLCKCPTINRIKDGIKLIFGNRMRVLEES